MAKTWDILLREGKSVDESTLKILGEIQKAGQYTPLRFPVSNYHYRDVPDSGYGVVMVFQCETVWVPCRKMRG